jgi:hypothetical protein
MNVRLLILALSLALLSSQLGGVPIARSPGQTGHAFQVLGESRRVLSWGGEYARLEIATDRGRVVLHTLAVYPERVRLMVALPPGGLGTLDSVEDFVRESGAVAGINANYYDPESRLPVGFVLKDGRALGTPYAERAVLAVEFFGRLHFLRPEISLALRTSHGSIPVEAVNRPALPDALVAFTPEYAYERGSWADARAVAVRDNRVIWTGSGGQARPHPLYVDPRTGWLVARGRAQERLLGLLPGDPVRLDYYMDPELLLVRDAFQAGPLLLRGGRVVLDRTEGFSEALIERPAARSAVALRRDGALLMMIATSGNGSAGLTLPELAAVLQQQGALDALALDGGGSSALVFRDGARLRTVGGSRGVPVGLVLLPRPR